jgi:hypothetical protein
MNEQALALYQYALEFAYENVGKEDSDKPYFQAIVAGKFAELMITEFITLADEFELDVNRSGLVDKIKYHFGVE